MFKKIGADVLAASPMLAFCWYSPSMCSIVKNFRLVSSQIAKFRLNHCQIMDNFIDSRVSDFQKSRQECVKKGIERHQGNMNRVMEECGQNKLWQFDVKDWSGSGQNVSENRLLGSSAKWAGIGGERGEKTLELVKSLVGDFVVARGSVRLDYGRDRIGTTPRLHYKKLQNDTYQTLCLEVLGRLKNSGLEGSVSEKIKRSDLQKISGEKEEILIDTQTIRSLIAMPRYKRMMACKKLASAIGVTKFTRDMGRSIDALYKMSQDVHLPDERKDQIVKKMNKLKDNVKFTMELHKIQNTPLNEVLEKVNRDGYEYIDESTRERLDSENRSLHDEAIEERFFDCADGVFCPN